MHSLRELVQPSVVTHAVACSLWGTPAFAVVRGGTLLEIFSVMPDNKLKHCWQTHLHGVVSGMSVLRQANKAQELLVVAIRPAKLVIVEWTDAGLNPVSLHYFEKNLESHPFYDDNFPAILRAEPQGICLSYMFQKDRIAMTDFTAFEVVEPVYDEEITASTTTYRSGESIVLSADDLGAANIVDFAYLSEYNEPTLAIIHQPRRTWVGSLALCRDNTHFTAMSIDIAHHSSTPILSISDLPYDLHTIIPLGNPLSGALLLGANLFVYINPAGRVLASAVNKMAKETTALQLSDFSHLEVNLENAKGSQLPGQLFVLIAAENAALTLFFRVDGSKVFDIEAEMIKLTPSPSTLCVNDFVFVGSRTGPAQLWRWSCVNADLDDIAGVVENDLLDDIDVLYMNKNASALKCVFNLSDELWSAGPYNAIEYCGQYIVATAPGGTANTENGSGQIIVFDTLLPIENPKLLAENALSVYTVENVLIVSQDSTSELFMGPNYASALKSTEFMYNEPTLAAGKCGSHIASVHTNRIVLYDKSWAKLKELAIEGKVLDAIVKPKGVAIRVGESCRVYSSELAFEFEYKLDTELLYAFGHEYLGIASGSVLRLYRHGEKAACFSFDMTQLPTVAEPLEAMTDTYAHNESNDITQILFANLASQEYLGVCVAELFSLYSFVGNKLYKAYTVPLPVRRPVFPLTLGGNPALLVSGRRAQLILKGNSTSVRCHALGTRVYSAAGTPEGKLVVVDGRDDAIMFEFPEGVDLYRTNLASRTINVPFAPVALSYLPKADVIIVGGNPQEERPEKKGVPEQSSEKPDAGVKIDDEDMEKMAYVGSSAASTGKAGTETLRNAKSKGDPIYGTTMLIDAATFKEVCTERLPIGEALCCAAGVELDVGSLATHREYVAVGSAVLLDEDNVSNGFISLYSVEGVGEKATLRLRYRELVRGAVTAVADVEGKLVCAQGQRVMIREVLDDQSAEGVAFLSTGVYLSALSVVRNVLVLGDLVQGVQLLYFGVEPYRLEVLSREIYQQTRASSAALLSSAAREDLFIAVADIGGALQIEQYDPETPASLGGTKLVRTAHMYLARQILTMTSFTNPDTDDVEVLASTREGSVFLVEPRSDRDFQALFVVSQQMADKEQPPLCLNPRAFWASHGGDGQPPALIDHHLVERFWDLPRDRQQHYARKLGFTGLREVYTALKW